MSAIGGIFNFDRSPVDDDLMRVLASQLAKRGPDGGGNVRLDSLAMVYRAFNTTRESHNERQPLVSSRGQILCWDGRLDNREELITNLGEELRGDRSDVDIVMAAYIKWGFDCLSRIIGTFALSLWDPASRSLFLARDIIGHTISITRETISESFGQATFVSYLIAPESILKLTTNTLLLI